MHEKKQTIRAPQWPRRPWLRLLYQQQLLAATLRLSWIKFIAAVELWGWLICLAVAAATKIFSELCSSHEWLPWNTQAMRWNNKCWATTQYLVLLRLGSVWVPVRHLEEVTQVQCGPRAGQLHCEACSQLKHCCCFLGRAAPESAMISLPWLPCDHGSAVSSKCKEESASIHHVTPTFHRRALWVGGQARNWLARSTRGALAAHSLTVGFTQFGHRCVIATRTWIKVQAKMTNPFVAITF